MRVIVGMATMPARENNVNAALESLRNQVDEIRLYDNGKESIDLTDNGKFRFLSDYDEPVYYFSCDDDLVYPRDYVAKSIVAIEKYNCIITYHGRYLLGKNRNYYRGHRVYRCLGSVKEDYEIDVAGTGVTAFRTDYFNPVELYKSEYKKMSDVVFSLEAAKHGKKIMLINHSVNWILQQKYMNNSTSIHTTESHNCAVQGLLCNEIIDLKGRGSND